MTEGAGPVASRFTRVGFVAAICAGSFLLFLIQPMVARMALPRLGGAPAVWNSAMLVYQALLLGGYAYAHWLGRFVPRRQALVHLALFLVAGLTLPISLAGATQPLDVSPVFWAPWLLVASIGPLFFMVSAQAPLMQRWYALSGGGDPYPLYAASNLGSFAGLISYPLLVEPALSVSEQSWLWSGGYVLLFLLVLGAARALPREARHEQAAAETAPAPGWRTILYWIALAAVPSGLMLSSTLHLTTDIVAMPLLWVLPLGAYLLSFSVAFAGGRSLALAMTAIAPLLLLMGGSTAFVEATKLPVLLAVQTLLTLFVVATALHSELYERRPAPAHLTRFYLAMSAGGVLGGIFCALVAPLLFDWTYEHPLLLAAAGLLVAREALFGWAERLWQDPGRRTTLTAVLLVVGLLVSMVGEGVLLPQIKSDEVKAAAFLIISALAITAVGNRILFAGMLAYMMLCMGGWSKLAQSVDGDAMTRSYFGVYSVRDNRDSRTLVHGTTLHGVQSRKPGRERDPTSYYAPRSGVGLAMQAAPALFGPGARIGVVGLGTGTLSCYARPGQHWRFYEIDPVMVRLARDSGRFTFLRNCLPQSDIALGDARITLSREAAGSRDLLAIDAFSSDSVPMHLLTREAFVTYGRVLSPKGLLLVHISNRYLDLEPVIAAAAREDGWHAAMRNYRPGRKEKGRFYASSTWIALSRDAGTLARLQALGKGARWQTPEARPGFAAWTDSHGSILPIMKLKF